uniref:Golgi transport complex component cog5 n=1 Tax=Colletotrichum fructicola (strain Nara gc5) TaxID=1213859 RepID=L2FNU8_COLFN
MTTQDEQEPSYIDYETFLSPDFNPASFANTLVLATNNPNDAPLDLSTPLSRVLFDTQEIDSHIDVLSTKSAAPLLQYTEEQNAASKRIIGELDAQIKSLNDSYRQLEKEVIDKHAEAEELGRQLEVQHAEIAGGSVSAAAAAAGKKEDHRALVRCSHTLLSLREVLDRSAPGEEGYGLGKVDAIRTLREGVIAPIERSVRETAEKIIRDFAIPNSATFAQGEETKARTVSAMVTLFLLSPQPAMKGERWTPTLLLQALEVYFRSALQSSIASLGPAAVAGPDAGGDLGAVPEHLTTPQKQTNMLQPLLAYLETGSLASYFWRTMAGSLGTRVQEIVNRGGVSARTLRTNRASVGEAVRECVVRGCEMPSALKGKGRGEGNWEREVAVMVGSVVNNLGR